MQYECEQRRAGQTSVGATQTLCFRVFAFPVELSCRSQGARRAHWVGYSRDDGATIHACNAGSVSLHQYRESRRSVPTVLARACGLFSQLSFASMARAAIIKKIARDVASVWRVTVDVSTHRIGLHGVDGPRNQLVNYVFCRLNLSDPPTRLGGSRLRAQAAAPTHTDTQTQTQTLRGNGPCWPPRRKGLRNYS